ncbi:MAG: SURF1 family cytochrome oxidase biogenesis protein [Gulosibacter sp.]|uniref:SURF1 family cytochrome oxidase biogenesis protein n=1 Tax=Gulosibacter sp. TaxID=2817531 RepID=UPI003F93B294
MLKTMVKPKWLALLAGAILIVVIFIALGKWQLDAAFESSGTAAESEAYETVVPLGDLVAPGVGITEENVARPMAVSGWLVPGDFEVVANRLQGSETGWWVVGHLAVADDGVTQFTPEQPQVTEEFTPSGSGAELYPGLPVAIGWAATEEEAREAIEALDAATAPVPAETDAQPAEFQGKIEALQEPVTNRDEDDPLRIGSMAAGQLINTWQNPAVSYYAAWGLIEDGIDLPAGLEPIEVVGIDDSFQLDLLNIFYAIEWAVFAIMAIYIWWRIVRDDYLQEQAADPIADLTDKVRREKLRALAESQSPRATASTPERTTPERN